MSTQGPSTSVVSSLASAVIGASLIGALLWAGPQRDKPSHTGWETYLGSPDSSHYSALKQINLSNVNKLEVAWSFDLGNDRSYEFSPIVVGKTMYVMAHHTSIVGLDATTGRELWVYHSKNAPPIEMHRGINFWQSKDGSEKGLLIPFASRLEAIDARTGGLIKSFGDDGTVDLMAGLGRDKKTISQIQS